MRRDAPADKPAQSLELEQMLAANRGYAADCGGLAALAVPPRRQLAILTCMDARLVPARFAGLAEGDAHVIRNAGGRVTGDAIEALMISAKILGTREWCVIHHTECAAAALDDEMRRVLLRSDRLPADASTDGVAPARQPDTRTIEDYERVLAEDVKTLREHPARPACVAVHGLLFEVRSATLRVVDAAP